MLTDPSRCWWLQDAPLHKRRHEHVDMHNMLLRVPRVNPKASRLLGVRTGVLWISRESMTTNDSVTSYLATERGGSAMADN